MNCEQRRDTVSYSLYRILQSGFHATLRLVIVASICVLMVTLGLKEAGAAVENHLASMNVATQGSEPSAATPSAKFRPNDEGYSGRIAGSLGFVLLVALAGFATVRFAKRKNSFVSQEKAAKDYGVRLLFFKRVAPRLSILVIDVGQGKVVTLADNGNSLLKLSEFDQNAIQTNESAREKPHEK